MQVHCCLACFWCRSDVWRRALKVVLLYVQYIRLCASIIVQRKFSAIPSILKNNFHLISSHPKLSKIFKQKPTVTYRKNKSLSDHLFKNDIANQQLHSNVTPCGKCKLFPQINTAKLITNDKLNKMEKIKGTGNCKEREIIYAAQCSKHKVLYIGHTGEQLSERFSKHCYDIKNRPDNIELAKLA